MSAPVDTTRPLTIAAWNGYSDIVKLLLKYEVDVNHKQSGKDTPLTLASYKGHKDVVEVLLKAGANNQVLDGGKVVKEASSIVCNGASDENKQNKDAILELIKNA